MIGDGTLKPCVHRGNLLEAPTLRHEHTSTSCPIIEHTEGSLYNDVPPIKVPDHSCDKLIEETKESKSCDVKLVINGMNYDSSDDAGIPLLGDLPGNHLKT